MSACYACEKVFVGDPEFCPNDECGAMLRGDAPSVMGSDGPIPDEWLPGVALAGALKAANWEVDGEDVDLILEELEKRGYRVVHE